MTASINPPVLTRLGGALLAGYPLVFGEAPFRTLFAVLLIAGTAQGMTMPYISVWANETFGIGPQAVAVLWVVSGLVGATINPLLGLISDRFGWRRLLITAQLVIMAMAFLGYTQASTYTHGLILVGLSGLGVMGLMLAMANDLVGSSPRGRQHDTARILAVERTGWSIGIILGPAIAAAIVTSTGSTLPVFVAGAAVQLLAAVVVWAVPEGGAGRLPASGKHPSLPDGLASPRLLSIGMIALLLGMMLLALPSQTRNMFLPLFVTQVLKEAPGAVGPLFTLNACVAVFTMPHVGGLADRFGAHRLLYLSSIAGALYCLLQSLAGSYTQALFIQMLIGFSIAMWSASALIYLQQLMPGRAGMAAGLYVGVQHFTPVLSGLMLGPIAEVRGIPAAFFTTAVLGVVALGLLLVGQRALSKR